MIATENQMGAEDVSNFDVSLATQYFEHVIGDRDTHQQLCSWHTAMNGNPQASSVKCCTEWKITRVQRRRLRSRSFIAVGFVTIMITSNLGIFGAR